MRRLRRKKDKEGGGRGSIVVDTRRGLSYSVSGVVSRTVTPTTNYGRLTHLPSVLLMD